MCDQVLKSRDNKRSLYVVTITYVVKTIEIKALRVLDQRRLVCDVRTSIVPLSTLQTTISNEERQWQANGDEHYHKQHHSFNIGQGYKQIK